MNGKACCILGVCCPPGSKAQLKALTSALMEAFGWDDAMTAYQVTPETVAAWFLEHFDLAPAGTLQGFKDVIAEMARKHPANPAP